MNIETKKENEVTILICEGSLDVSHQVDLKEKLADVIDAGHTDVIFDFHKVSFIDSSCLGVLVSLTKKLRETKGDLKLVNLSEDVRSIFQITRLDRVFEIFDNNQNAIDSFYR